MLIYPVNCVFMTSMMSRIQQNSFFFFQTCVLKELYRSSLKIRTKMSKMQLLFHDSVLSVTGCFTALCINSFLFVVINFC